MRHPDPNFGYSAPTMAEKRWHASVIDVTSLNTKTALPDSFMRKGAMVLDSHIDAVSWTEAVMRIANWAAGRQSRFVTLCNVHSVVTASQDPGFHRVIAQADLALPDGAPIAWALRQEGHAHQQRINGPDLMWRYLETAERLGQSVFFYGASQHTLDLLRDNIARAFPKLRVAGMVSPPFQALTPEEDQAHVDLINASGANVVFVGLGCPKQEAWMANHRGRIQSVMLGVGAAFDYHAGTIRRAPKWMQHAGLEWLHRLCSEPRRLAKRYAVTNTIFAARMLRNWLLGPSVPKQPRR